MALNPSKFDRIYSNLTPSARKVYECTPSEEPWPVHKVMDALVTRGVSMRIQVVHGCLSALTQEGVVKEAKKNEYIRVPVKLPEEDHNELEPFNPVMAESLKKALESEPVKETVQQRSVPLKEAMEQALPPSQDFTPKPKEETVESRISFLQQRVRNAMKELDEVLKELDTVKAQAKKHQTDSSLLAALRKKLGI